MTISTRTPGNIDAVPLLSGSGFGAVVGGDTALVTSDGDTSYVEVSRYSIDDVGVVRTGHTFTFAPAGSIPPDAVVTIEADWWTDTNGGFAVGFVHPTMGGRSVGSFVPTAGVHNYGDPGTITVSPIWVEDGEAFGPGIVWSVEALFALTPGPVTRVTRLTMRIETTSTVQRPHLIFDRTDALGAGAGFVFGRDTRQSSGLVFGNT